MIERAFPLTPLQEGMLYHTLLEPRSGLYHGQCEAVLKGRLHEDAFREAWTLAAARHEVFRTAFAWERRERPLQVVLDRVSLDLRFLDWTELDPDVRKERWAAVLAKDRQQSFDLTKAPPMRWVVVREGEESHRLLWGSHHALLDGWSALSVLGEVFQDYEDRVAGHVVARPPAPSYAQFVGWLGEQDEAAARAYWTDTLAGMGRATPLPVADVRAASPHRVTTELKLSLEDTAAAGAAAARMRVTMNTMIVAAWARILSRRTGDRNVIFGVTVSERPAVIPDVDVAAGLYLNTVPARVHLPGSIRVGEWLSGLQRDLSEGRAHGAPGLSQIQRWSEVSDGPLFQSLVVFERFPAGVGEGLSVGMLQVDEVAMRGPSDLPLALLAYPGDRLRFEMIHDPTAVTPHEAMVLLDELAEELRVLRGDPGRLLSEVGPHGPRTQVGPQGWPGGSRVEGPPLERDVVDVIALFEAQAGHRPEAIALSGPSGRLSYGELDRFADEVARRILSAGGRAGTTVAVLAERTAEGIIGILGVLKAGCAYIPMDPAHPSARLEAMASGTDLLLCSADLATRLASGQGRVIIPDVRSFTPQASTPVRAEATPPDCSAYTVFTSGSTGQPKGVVVSRAQLAWSTAARLQYYDHHPGCFLLLSSITVDSAVAGIYWTLCSGGALVLPDTRGEQDLDGLTRLISDEGVTHTLLVPSLYKTLLEESNLARLGSLRLVVVAGEACHPEVVRAHRRALPGVDLYNEYGPSEATVWATADELTAHPEGPVSIGRPVPSARVYLLDPQMREVSPGVAGEIWIAGPGVAQGYLRSPDLTSERFVDDPLQPEARMYRTGDWGRLLEDGRLEFLGRMDDQIKVRGHRVESGEIESAISAHPAVREALVALAEPYRPESLPPEAGELTSALLGLSSAVRERMLLEVEAMDD